MNKANLKFLVILDESLHTSVVVEEVARRYKQEMEEATGGEVSATFDYIREDLSKIEWVDPYPDWTWCVEQWNEKEAEHKDKYDFIYYVVDQSNWKGEGYAGLHRGIIQRDGRNPYSICFARHFNAPDTLWLAWTMEPAHSFDTWGRIKEPRVNLNALFDVPDFDEDVIHGRDARYPRYKYKHVYTKLKDYFIKWFPNTINNNNMKLVIDRNNRVWAVQNGKKFWILDPATRDALVKVCGEPVQDDLPVEEYAGAIGWFNTDNPNK